MRTNRRLGEHKAPGMMRSSLRARLVGGSKADHSGELRICIAIFSIVESRFVKYRAQISPQNLNPTKASGQNLAERLTETDVRQRLWQTWQAIVVPDKRETPRDQCKSHFGPHHLPCEEKQDLYICIPGVVTTSTSVSK
ncbi:hypothetical protein N7G274_004571 [Stereocaulon virgatum]|uniref:Uncharacterized protein n=1 Tax=Stereocaulon virgatum TaxID=373712 RepID=A0ABR4AE15_9LECA